MTRFTAGRKSTFSDHRGLFFSAVVLNTCGIKRMCRINKDKYICQLSELTDALEFDLTCPYEPFLSRAFVNMIRLTAKTM